MELVAPCTEEKTLEIIFVGRKVYFCEINLAYKIPQVNFEVLFSQCTGNIDLIVRTD